MNKKFAFKNIMLSDINEDTEFFPLMSDEDEKKMGDEKNPEVLPILPLKNTVLFPGVVIPITIARDKSIQLIKDADKANNFIGVLSQKDSSIESPSINDFHSVGTVAQILKMLKMPDGNITAVIQGRKRFELKEIIQENPYFKGRVDEIVETKPISSKEFDASISSIKDLALRIIEESPSIPSEASIAIKNIKSSSFVINFVSSNMNISVAEKQALLNESDVNKKALRVLELLTKELQMLEMKNEIQSKVRTDLDQQQREYFLNQQMKAIQEELGGTGSAKEIDDMKIQASKKKWLPKIKDAFDKELKKLQRMNP